MNRRLTFRRRRLTTAAAAAVGAALLLAGCGGGDDSGGGPKAAASAPADKTLHLSFLQDPGQPPDPDIYYAGQGLLLTTNIYEGLLTYQLGTDKPVIAPQLATKWEVSADKKTYTLQLRKGVVFHDGTPFTSAAVKPSFDRRLAVNQGPAYMVADVAKVETPDDYTVVITLKDANTAFLDYLAAPYSPRMMSPTGLKANAGSDHAQTYLQTHDLGSGPYTLTQAEVGSHYAMARFDKWWGEKPYFDKVDIPVIADSSSQQLQFDKGAIAAITHDLNASATKNYLKNKNVATYALPTFSVQQLYMNPNTGFLKSKENRNALQASLDLKTIAKQVFEGRGEAATTVYPPGMLSEGKAPQDIAYDPAKIQAAIQAAPAGERTLTFGYDTSSPDDQLVANIISAKLQGYGLTVKVQGYPTSQIFGWISDPKGAPDVYIGGFWPDAAHPYAAAHILFAPDGGLNYLHCSDPQITEELPKALVSGSEDEFATIGSQAYHAGCVTTIATRPDFTVAQKWLKGVEEAHGPLTPTSLYLPKLSAGTATS